MRNFPRFITENPVAQRAYRCAVSARLGIERWALAYSGPTAPVANQGRILAYHSVGTPEWGMNDVRPRDFERHLQIAADDGWTFATPAEVMAAPAERLLALTFDDGIRSVLRNAAPVLRHHNIPATAFIVTGWADGGHPDGHAHLLDWPELLTLRDSGMALASHSVTHRDFQHLDAATTRAELEVSREKLQQMLRDDVDEFAIPFGQSRNWPKTAREAAAAAGYTTVYAQAVDTRPAGTVARTFVTRLDRPKLFQAALSGRYDNWEEWY